MNYIRLGEPIFTTLDLLHAPLQTREVNKRNFIIYSALW